MILAVCGGAGFIGSHLCERLLDDGHRVICIDNLITGNPENIARLQGREQFEFLACDVTDASTLGQIGALDGIFHLASPASPVDYLRIPFETVAAGSLGTWRLLELARSRNARFLLASTSEIYGEPGVHPQSESYWGNVNPIGPRSVYDESKRFSEMLTALYRREHGVDTSIVRIFNTYGPHMRPADGRVVPNFVLQALAGNALTVYGNGMQTRSFCYCSDLVEGLVRLFASGEHDPVNLGNPQEVTVRELAELISTLVGQRAPVVFRDLPQDDPTRRCPDIARARAILGWEPRVPLVEGLRHTIDWFAGQRARTPRASTTHVDAIEAQT